MCMRTRGSAAAAIEPHACTHSTTAAAGGNALTQRSSEGGAAQQEDQKAEAGTRHCEHSRAVSVCGGVHEMVRRRIDRAFMSAEQFLSFPKPRIHSHRLRLTLDGRRLRPGSRLTPREQPVPHVRRKAAVRSCPSKCLSHSFRSGDAPHRRRHTPLVPASGGASSPSSAAAACTPSLSPVETHLGVQLDGQRSHLSHACTHGWCERAWQGIAMACCSLLLQQRW